MAAPIEQQLYGVEDAVQFTSRCTNDGRYILAVTFKPGTSREGLDLAQIRVQNRVSLALPLIPELVQFHGISVKKRAAAPIALAHLSWQGNQKRFEHLSAYAMDHVRVRLAMIVGVGEVSVFGTQQTRSCLNLDPGKLADRQLALLDVAAALKKQRIQLPGRQRPGEMDRLDPLPPGEIAEVVVKTDAQGRIVRLKDLGQIEQLTAAKYAGSGGRPGVALAVYPLSEIGDIGRETVSVLGERFGFPDGLGVEVFDFTANVRAPGSSATREYLLIDLQLPRTFSAQQTIEALKRCEKLLAGISGVQDVLAHSESPFDLGSDRPCLLVRLAPAGERKASRQEIVHSIRTELGKVEGAGVSVRDLSRPGSFPRFCYPIEFAISGKDAVKVQTLADRLADRLRQSGKLTDVWANQDHASRPAGACLTMDSVKAQAQGVPLADIFSTFELYLGRGDVADPVRAANRLQVVLPAGSVDRKRLDDLMQLRIKNGKGDTIPLKSMVSIEPAELPAAINRLDGRPCVALVANPADNVALTEARIVCEKAFEELRRDAGDELRLTWR